MLLDIDVNSDLLALDINDRFTFALARTLSLDTSRADSGTFDQTGAPSLLDQYDYVMYGKVRVCRRTPQRSQPHRARILRAFRPCAYVLSDVCPRLALPRVLALRAQLYKWKQDNPKAPVDLYVSFGGLLMRLKGDADRLSKLQLDSRIYLLLRNKQVAS
jgi:DNA-directed RNA polymerase I, II, and III subunit RPABC3